MGDTLVRFYNASGPEAEAENQLKVLSVHGRVVRVGAAPYVD